MGGSFAPGYGLRLLGYRTSREEIEAMMHFWRYVGHLMGVQPRWYPESVEDALGLMFASEVKGVCGSGDDGKNLARSYLASYAPTERDSWRDALVKRFEHGLQKGYASWFVPPQTHARFGLPRATRACECRSGSDHREEVWHPGDTPVRFRWGFRALARVPSPDASPFGARETGREPGGCEQLMTQLPQRGIRPPVRARCAALHPRVLGHGLPGRSLLHP
jgi:hypothetical protein